VIVYVCAAVAGLGLLSLSGEAALSEDDFPIIGTYTRDTACTATSSARSELLVRITRAQIESQLGVCRIVSRTREDRVIAAHVECKVPGAAQPILGDVTFTLRDDKTVGFEDQDHTSDAILHRCSG